MTGRPPRKSFLMRLPVWARERGAWVYLGFLFSVVGVASLLGFVEPTAITAAMKPWVFNAWGFFLAFSGVGIIYSNVKPDIEFERFFLRILIIVLTVYASWATAVVGVERAGVSVVLSMGFVTVAGFRSLVIGLFLRAIRRGKIVTDEGDCDES